MNFLRTRNRQPEMMDQPGLDQEMHHHALRGLKRVNVWSGSIGSIWNPIRQLAITERRPIKVLDIASGGGDTAIGLWKRANKSGLDITIDGCDISDTAIEYASKQAAEENAKVSFFNADAIGGGLPTGYDVICSSLFLHHLDEPDIVSLLKAMKQRSERMVVISDLLRSPIGYVICWCGIRILTRSKICHVDGPLSVEGAFTIPELQDLAKQAGLPDMTFQRRWPERCLMTWSQL